MKRYILALICALCLSVTLSACATVKPTCPDKNVPICQLNATGSDVPANPAAIA